MTVEPFSLRDTPSLIEYLLPVQKLSIEAYKEQMAGNGKTLTPLGSYWKGRKPLILNKACVLGCLLPATNNPIMDLEIFEMLMGMDFASFVPRWKSTHKPKDILAKLSISRIRNYFELDPVGVLPISSPIDWSNPENSKVNISWRKDVSLKERRELEAQLLPKVSYRNWVELARRPEEVFPSVHEHIWDDVNRHLGTNAFSFPELVEQLGIMRFGHRPRVADLFCGSGQIPFEAARLGCDTYAADLNPIASLLTWGAFNIIGTSVERQKAILNDLDKLILQIQAEIDNLKIEEDGKGWKPKAFLYCHETRCPQTGYLVPLLSSRIVSKDHNSIVDLIPDPDTMTYKIQLRNWVSEEEFAEAEYGTVRRGGRGLDPYLVHIINGNEYRTKISTIRGDYTDKEGNRKNKLRLWENIDFKPRMDDVFQERLYAIQWEKTKSSGKGEVFEFRSVTEDDLGRERAVDEYLTANFLEWQKQGWIPNMRIENGYNTDQPIWERGWSYWHQLFNPRQLLYGGLLRKYGNAFSSPALTQCLNWNSKLSVWNRLIRGGGGTVQQSFINQALNTLYEYGCRPFSRLKGFIRPEYKQFQISTNHTIDCAPAVAISDENDIYITDPPYGDAVNYDEILEFFISWLRKNPPEQFAEWIWDSRRSLAIKGSDEEFRLGMVAAYSRMVDFMPANGMQIIMFTHQSGSIWADMANIVWASGLQVSAAWYVVTETESALREGSYVKGTVLLVCRKRKGEFKTSRDDLAWELQEEVNKQIETLTGLNQQAKGIYRDENVFEDADIQMAGYAAALRVLTKYRIIDGRDMTIEAQRPRVKGETTFVDNLINFAVDTANQCLVPGGIPKKVWDRLSGPERFYLKLIEMEARGAKTLDNYQNFAKAFKVRDFKPFMASQKANSARLNSAVEFGRAEMNEASEFYRSTLRAVLYAIMELEKDMDGKEVLAHLMLNVPEYYSDFSQREIAIELSTYLMKYLESIRPSEASSARVLAELLKNQRLG